MLVDDRSANLNAITAILADFDVNILTASSGNDALALALKHEFAVILMDAHMPGMDGFETATILRSRIQTPVIFLTAFAKGNDRILKAYKLGAADFIFKPFIPELLKSKVTVFVDLYRQRKELEQLNRSLKNKVQKQTRQLKQTNQALQQFVPKDFLRLLNRKNIIEVQPGDCVYKKMTILFADIRSFTALSETMNPSENFKFVNSYISFMAPAILENNGFIDKYIGDAIMALFENASDAVAAAIKMFDTLAIYNGYRKKTGYRPIRIGVGINTGVLTLGTVGGKIRMDGTVIGDAVNLASHIEQLTKRYQASVLIGPETFLTLHDSLKYQTRFIDCVNLKGKKKEVMIYEVLDADPPEIRKKKIKTLKQFEQALSLFQAGGYLAARSLFQKCSQQNPGDKAAKIYLDRCEYLISHYKPIDGTAAIRPAV